MSMYARNFNRRGRGNLGSTSVSRGLTPRSYVWSWKPVNSGSDRYCYPAITDVVNQQAQFIERDRNNALNEMAHLLSTMSTTELRASGYAMAGLQIAEQRINDYCAKEVRLEAASEDMLLLSTAMRIGEIVRLDDAANDDVVRSFDLDVVGPVMGTISSQGPLELMITLRTSQKIPAHWSDRCSVSKLIFDIPFKRMLIALRDLVSYPWARPPLHQVVYLGATPRFYGRALLDSDFVDESLNQSQKDAVQLAITANAIALIHGPPGTGKTRVLIEIIRQQISHLGVSSSGSPPHTTSAGAISNSAVIRSKQVVLSSLLNAGGRDLRGDSGYCGDFDVVIIDNATQAFEGESWIAALKAPKLILAGDSNQLYPMFKNADGSAVIAGGSLGSQPPHMTLFERVLGKHGDKVSRTLQIQYRMHADIMQVSANELYKDNIVADGSVAGHVLCDLEHVETNEYTRAPLVLLETAGRGITESLHGSGTFKGRTTMMSTGPESWINTGEAQLAMTHVEKLLAAGVDVNDIAIFPFYDAQVALLKGLGEERYPELEIGSVDTSQGREKEAVVLSMVRSNPGKEVGFLKDVRLMNVALTRARRHLCIIADSSTVSEGDPFLTALFVHLKSKALILHPST